MKKIISLDFIIIFIGGFLFLMSWPSATILHFLLFFCASVFYFWVDYRRGSLFQKQLALFIVIFVVLGTAFVTEISARRHDDSIFVHDNVLQVESAAQILWQGRNPYAENYFGTELEKFSYISTVSGQLMLNPALFHCIKLPFHLLFSVPFYLLFNNLWQFFDERLVYLILFIISLFALYQLPKRTESKFALAAAYASLDDAEYMRRSREWVQAEREFMYAALDELDVSYHRSQANFVLLVDLPLDGKELSERLIHRGVIVRPMGGWGLPRAVRVSLGTREQNEQVVAALRAALNGAAHG